MSLVPEVLISLGLPCLTLYGTCTVEPHIIQEILESDLIHVVLRLGWTAPVCFIPIHWLSTLRGLHKARNFLGKLPHS
jgi:hypothetical protein